jgi:hypothetical protein
MNETNANKGTMMDDNRAAIESAMVCLKEAQTEIALYPGLTIDIDRVITKTETKS